MRINLSKFERVAGVFVAVAFGVALFVGLTVAVKQGWFEPRVDYITLFDRASGVFPGTKVEMAGLRVGAVEEVELKENNKVLVRFSVMEKYTDRIRRDSYIQSSRLFVIGDKVLDVVVGSPSSAVLEPGSLVPHENSFDILEAFDSRNIGPWVKTIGQVGDNLRIIAEAFTDKDRTKSLISIFDQMEPLLKNANKASLAVTEMSKQMTHNQNLQVTMENFRVTSAEFGNMVREMPHLGKDMAEAMRTLNSLVVTLNEMMPAIQEIAPEMPRVTRRAVEALDEAVIVMKAMQKSFMLSGSAKDVREEEAKRKQEQERKPAGE